MFVPMNSPPPPPPPPPLIRQLTTNKWEQGRSELEEGGCPVCVGIVRDAPESSIVTVYCLVSWVVPGEGMTEVTSRLDLREFPPCPEDDFPPFRCVAEAVQEDVLLAPFARRLQHLNPPCLRKPTTLR